MIHQCKFITKMQKITVTHEDCYSHISKSNKRLITITVENNNISASQFPTTSIKSSLSFEYPSKLAWDGYKKDIYDPFDVTCIDYFIENVTENLGGIRYAMENEIYIDRVKFISNKNAFILSVGSMNIEFDTTNHQTKMLVIKMLNEIKDLMVGFDSK